MDTKIQVIGLGYIGLPTAICFAEKFDIVYGCDVSKKKINDISNYIVDKNEPGLVEKLKLVYPDSLSFLSEVTEADVHIICVPTPFNKDMSPNLDYIFNVIDNLSCKLKKGDLVILESTSPIGTTEKIRDKIAKNRSDLYLASQYHENNTDVSIAYSPERVMPGNIFQELYGNNRVVGGITKVCANKVSKIYKHFVKGDITVTDTKTAEFVKLGENTYRDINIAIANEFSMMANSANLDIQEIIKISNQHPRVNILSPGTGVGGHCLAVDPYFLINSFPNDSLLTSQARKVNLIKEKFSFSQIINFIDSNKVNNISLFGISYKADSSDLRESPSYRLFKKLLEEKDIFINLCEPNITDIDIDIDLESDQYRLVNLNNAIDKGDAYIFLVPHYQFKEIVELKINKPILDLCNLYV
jgi:UDP-N-acetyl-D-mannosaminuronic acid dehydrogenase